MPHFRQNFITREWVIIAPERAKRPDQFKSKDVKKEIPKYVDSCPFCPGNEKLTPPTIEQVENGGKWSQRVVTNKFATVDPEAKNNREIEGPYLKASGFGFAEVLIESPEHNQSLATMSVKDVANVIRLYKSRYLVLSSHQDVDLITIFKNHGAKAGTSLEHPHSQIIATSIVPPHVRIPMHQAQIYHDSYGDCPYCVMIRQEKKDKDRIILEEDNFISFCPFASRSPFEIRIMPKGHCSQFSCVQDSHIDELAHVLRTSLRKLHFGLDDPDYNFVIRSTPTSDGEMHYEHWRLLIYPKLTTPAGFEIGTGVFINIMAPEEAAKFLRQVKE